MIRRLVLAVASVAAMMIVPAGSARAECQCRYDGKVFEQGQLVCIRVGGATRLARCDMALNNSSWIFLERGCPTALVTSLPTKPADHAEVN
jgi:hypothetical protein